MKVVLVGAGNITNTKHIPALLKMRNEFEIIGVISNERSKIDRTIQKYNFIKNTFLIDSKFNTLEQLRNINWIKEADFVIIGSPPQEHFDLSFTFLSLGKNVLVEKPFVMTSKEADILIKLSIEKELILNVMHSFHNSKGILKLKKLKVENYLGNIQSMQGIQFTNRRRRLPIWYNELPFGLFFDESAHFFYTSRSFGGELRFKDSSIFQNNNENTPKIIQAQFFSGGIPVQITMNFNSPICEWFFIVFGEDKIAIYDYFKDILIILNNDELHLPLDVLKTVFSFLFQYIKGLINNFIFMISKNLYYGHDVSILKFSQQIIENKFEYEMSAYEGKEVIVLMNEIIENCR